MVSAAERVAEVQAPAAGVASLAVIGTGGTSNGEPVFTFPERDDTGGIVGINRRFATGSVPRQMMVRGGRRGLCQPVGWREGTGPLFVVEGVSDALAITFAGLRCIGRPSNTRGVTPSVALLADWPKHRPIVLCGENDADLGGGWPGMEGEFKPARG